jgi:hypothetical protein
MQMDERIAIVYAIGIIATFSFILWSYRQVFEKK